MNRRHCASAAITLVCALTVLITPVQAFAEPAPPSPSDAKSAASKAPKKSLEEVRKEIDDLYRKAGRPLTRTTSPRRRPRSSPARS